MGSETKQKNDQKTKKETKIGLSVVIPGRNQGKILDKTLGDIFDYQKNLPFDIEVIYVDGDSDDETPQTVEKYKKSHKNFFAYEVRDLSKFSKGKGAQVKSGMAKATGKYKMFLDSDSSTPFKEVEKLLKYLDEGYDIAMGSRYTDKPLPATTSHFKAFWKALKEVLELVFTGKTKSNITKKKQPWLRQFISRGGNLAFVTLLGQSFADTRCGFKAYKGQAADTIFSRQTLPGFGFDTEILVIAKKFGLKIIEVPVDWYDDEEDTNIDPLRDTINSFKEIFIIRWNMIKGKYK